MAFTPLTLSSLEQNWQMMWHGVKVEAQSLKHQPSTGTCIQDWSPYMSFILKGYHNWALRLKGWFKSNTSIHIYRNEIQYSYWTCAWIIWYMFLVQCEELRISHLTPFLLVTMPYACWLLWRAYYIENFKWHRHFQHGVAFCKVVLREIFIWRATLHLKRIEDFDLKH